MTRRSAPRPRRCEAKECRSECGLIFRATAVRRMYLRTILCDRSRRQPSAAVVQEEGLAARRTRRELRPGPAVGLEGFAGLVAERDDPFLLALAPDPDEPFAEVDVGRLDADKLADADPRRVEELEDGLVAEVQGGGRAGQVEELGRLSLGQEGGDALLLPGGGQDPGRVLGDPLLPDAIIVERTQGGQLAADGRLLALLLVELGQEAAQDDVARLVPADLPFLQIGRDLPEVASVAGHGVRRGVLLVPEEVQELSYFPVHRCRRARPRRSRPGRARPGRIRASRAPARPARFPPPPGPRSSPGAPLP